MLTKKRIRICNKGGSLEGNVLLKPPIPIKNNKNNLINLKDSLDFAKKLILETNVGVAPGIAFGTSGEGHLRICFAAKESFINQIMDRLEPVLNR